MAYHSAFQALGSVTRDTGTATTVSLATNKTSGPMSPTGEMFNFAYQFAIVSGTPNGSFFVDVSNDQRNLDPIFSANAVWTPVQEVIFTAGLNNGLANCFVVVQNGARFSRCRWVSLDASAGTGWAVGGGMSV